jgi:hypothetical protein
MARATRADSPGAWYHVLNREPRGERSSARSVAVKNFIRLLSSLSERFGVRLHSYALMGNHYHLVQAVSNVWNEAWEELLSARGTGAHQTALFIGRIRGRLSLKRTWTTVTSS